MLIKGFEGVLYIEEFSLVKRRGQHSQCTFTAAIKENDCGKFLSKVGDAICVLINEGRRPIFWGEIDSIELEQTFARTVIGVTATSLTRRIDEERYTRIFQNPSKTVGDILNSSRLSMSDCSLKIDNKLSSVKIEHIELQYRETNFEFIKRIALRQGFDVWAIDTRQNNPIVHVGKCIDDSETAIKNDDLIRLKICRHKKTRSATMISRRFIDIGRLIKLEGDSRRYLVTGLELYCEGGADRFKYDLTEFRDGASDVSDGIDCIDEFEGRLYKFRAEVTAIDDPKKQGRIQIHFDETEVEDRDSARQWIPYRTHYNRIDYVPDVGDKLEVFVGGGECYICSALRKSSIKSKLSLNTDSIEALVGDNKLRLDEKALAFKGNNVKIEGSAVKIGTKVELG